MDLLLFTKPLRGASAEDTARAGREVGVDGLDLALRAGYCVSPQDFPTTLRPALAVFADQGLHVPMVTLEGSWTDPAHPPLRELAHACAETGIPYLKLGYWDWSLDEGYWNGLARVRRDLADFADLAEEAGVCFLLHNHSGTRFGSHATGAMLALEGIDPDRVGLYLDPGHLCLEGEPIAMAVDIARRALRMVAAKNARHRFLADGRGSRWVTEWVQLSEGIQRWPETIAALQEVKYTGPISVHGEYSGAPDAETTLRRLALDVDFLRNLTA